MQAIWSRFGADLEQSWRRLGGALEAIWRRFGGGLEAIWRRFGGDLQAIWRRFEGDVKAICGRLDGDLEQMLTRSAGGWEALCRRFGRGLKVFRFALHHYGSMPFIVSRPCRLTSLPRSTCLYQVPVGAGSSSDRLLVAAVNMCTYDEDRRSPETTANPTLRPMVDDRTRP